jgi:tetratricopeptide (TPR) repeat protein
MEPSSDIDRHAALIGREREFAELRSGFHRASGTSGRLFLLVGEPGIGKTRLSDEIAGYGAEQGATVVWGRCWQGGGTPDYWPWIQVLRSMLNGLNAEALYGLLGSGADDIATILSEFRRNTSEVDRSTPSPGDPEQDRFRLFESVAVLVRRWAQKQSLLIILDDLHDADRSSLELLRFIARDLKNVPLLLVATYRDAEVKRTPDLSRVISEIAREGIQIPLAGLNVAEVTRLVTETAGIKPPIEMANSLHRATGGNPLFIDGVVRMMAAYSEHPMERFAAGNFHIPHGLREAIRGRLAFLSRPANSALSKAAVIGDEFDQLLLQQLSGADLELRDVLDEASKEGLVLRVKGVVSRYRFCHPLIRNVLYEDLSTRTRLETHRAIGESLERLFVNNLQPHLSEVAFHFVQAAEGSDDMKAIDYSDRAAEAAFRAFAYERAASHLEDALALMDRQPVDRPRYAQLLERLGAIMCIVNLPRGVEYLERSLRLYEELDDANRAALVHLHLGNVLSLRSPLWDISSALSHFRLAETVLGREPDTEAAVRVYIGMSLVFEQMVDTERGLESTAKALQICDRIGNVAAWAEAASQHANDRMRKGELALAFDLLDRAWAKADKLDMGFSVARGGGYLRLALWDPQGASEWYARELAKPRTKHAPYRKLVLASADSMARAFAGDLPAARALLSEPAPDLVTGLVAWYGGDWEEAEEILRRGLSYARRAGSRDDQGNYSYFLSRVLRSRRFDALAESLLKEALTLTGEHCHMQWQLMMRPDLALLCVESGRLAEARDHLAHCSRILSDGENWRGLVGHFAQAEAVVLCASGRMDKGEESFHRAVEVFNGYHAPWEESEALIYWGQSLLSQGETQRATEKFERARSIYRSIGTGARWIERLDECAHPISNPQDDSPATASSGGAIVQEPSSSSSEGAFIIEGDIWTVAYGGHLTRLKDIKGLHYLARLLGRPGREIHALDLIGAGDLVTLVDESSSSRKITLEREDLHFGLTDHSGEMLDKEAKASYKRRVDELQQELEDAKEIGNAELADKIQEEIEAIARELRRAIGLGGRDRRSASNSERARLSVTRAIKIALDRISVNDGELGRLLSKTIQTGTFCSYNPDPDAVIVWRVQKR